MIRRFKKIIEGLREQPEHVRIRAASYMTIVAGAVLLVIWLAVFLPLQLYWQRDHSASPSPTPVLTSSPTIIASPQINLFDTGTLFSPAPTPSQLISPEPSPAAETPLETINP